MIKTDFLLLFISFVFSLLWLLLKDVESSLSIVVTLLRYIPILFLYIKYFRPKFDAILPILLLLYSVFLYLFGGYSYNWQTMLVLVMIPITLFVYCQLALSKQEISLIVLSSIVSFFIYFIISNRFYINPNQVAFVFLVLFLIIFNGQFLNSKYQDRMTLAMAIIIIISLIAIYRTESRTSLMVFLLIPIAFLFKKRFKNLKLIYWIIVVMGVLYPWVYCQFASDYSWRYNVNTNLMDQDIFSGRQIIWNFIFSQLGDSSHFWFGGMDTSWWDKSMHNSSLDIISTFGVPTFVILVFVIYFYFNKICNLCQEHLRPLLLLVLVAMIWGLNESGLLMGYSYFLFLPFCLILSKQKELDYFDDDTNYQIEEENPVFQDLVDAH